MRATRDDLPILFGTEAAGIRGVDWGGVRVALVAIPAGAVSAPLLKGLPDDRCPCPHWGYVLKGRMRVTYAHGEETLTAGDLFYLPPGHTVAAVEDVRYVELSPPAAHDAFIAVATRTTWPGPARREASQTVPLVVEETMTAYTLVMPWNASAVPPEPWVPVSAGSSRRKGLDAAARIRHDRASELRPIAGAVPLADGVSPDNPVASETRGPWETERIAESEALEARRRAPPPTRGAVIGS